MMSSGSHGAFLTDVSRETLERLEIFAGLVEKWTSRINLVSRNSLAALWDRHIRDSLQVFDCAPEGRIWVDMGSGGGFPGLVVAILAAEKRPDMQVTLIESDQRKATFLRTAIRETGIPGRVLSDRIENVPPQAADILSARALADLTTLLGFMEPHLAPGGTALFPKGVTWEKEVDAARQQWRFDVEPVKSITEDRAVILKIKGAQRV